MDREIQMIMTFFKIGAFTLGGGYAMIPIIEAEVVERHKWLSREEFADIIAVAQSCPGALAINMSVFIGYRLRRLPGAVCTCLATALPSFLIILLIALFFHRFQDVPWVAAMFRGIRPAVVALIIAPVLSTAKSAKIGYKTVAIPIAVALLIFSGIPLLSNPILYIIAGGCVGAYIYCKRVKEER